MQIIKKQMSERILTCLKSFSSPTRPTLFFLHGFPDTPYVFKNQIEYFKSDFNILAPFAPGTDGEKISQPPLLDEIAQDYIKLIELKELEEVILVAHDLGGAIAGRMAQLAPERINQMILINATTLEQLYYRKKYLTQILKSFYMLLFQSPTLAKSMLKLNWKWLQKRLLKLNNIDSTHHHLPTSALEGIYQYKTFSREISHLITEPRRKLATPTMLIFSQQDPFLNVPTQEELSAVFEQARMQLLDGHHWLPLEYPELVNDHIEVALKAA